MFSTFSAVALKFRRQPQYTGVLCSKQPLQEVRKYRGKPLNVVNCSFLGIFLPFSRGGNIRDEKHQKLLLFQKQSTIRFMVIHMN